MPANRMRTVSPATNEVIVERQETSLEDVQAAATRARKAYCTWRTTTLEQRKVVVAQALQLIQARKHMLGKELTLQMGRPIACSVKEIDTMQKRANYLLNMAEEALADIPGQQEQGFRRWIKKVPVGPTLIIFAWNFPYLIIVNALIPALLAGNTVLLKPSPQTPLIGERMVEIFLEAGLPSDVLQCIHCGDIGLLKSIVQIPDIQLITFTGSTKVGLELREATANRILPLNLELGGNDPAYVRADADLKYAAAQIVDAAVFNAGQSCCAVERVYAHNDIFDALVKYLQEELEQYKLGDPLETDTNIGPVISQVAQKSIIEQVDDALRKGATDATPLNTSFTNPPVMGNYVSPRILVGATHDMKVMAEETFGPLLPVAKVSSDDEAVRLMNDSVYGLTASVWTTNICRGEELMEQLEAGTVFLNRADYPSPDLAWTGWKNSGLGCTLGPKGFDAFFKLKSFHIKEQQA